MKSLKKILLLCLGVVMIMMFFSSCESNEKKEKQHVNESFQSLEECINSTDSTKLKEMFVIFKDIATGRTIPVPNHGGKQIAIGTLRSILKMMGLL